MIDGEPWFFGLDVLRALDMDPDHSSNAYRKLDPNQRANLQRTQVGMRQGRPLVVISEAGLYRLVMRSDKPDARVFQNWVTDEVLPAIRKTGRYALADHGREAMPLPMDIAEALALAIKPVVAELTSVKALLAATLEQREATSMDELKRGQMFSARDLQIRGIGRGLTVKALTGLGN